MPQYKQTRVGSIFDTREVVADRGSSGGKRWKWRCRACGTGGVSDGSMLRRQRCKCRRNGAREIPFGVVIGKPVYPHGQVSYRTRCTRCGAETVPRRRTEIGLRETCAACRNKFDVFGKLMTLDEIIAVFRIKKSTLHTRTGQRGMTLEAAILLPVQPQDHSGKPRKELKCRVCRELKPLDEFHSDKSRKDGRTTLCRSCLALQRARRRSASF